MTIDDIAVLSVYAVLQVITFCKLRLLCRVPCVSAVSAVISVHMGFEECNYRGLVGPSVAS